MRRQTIPERKDASAASRVLVVEDDPFVGPTIVRALAPRTVVLVKTLSGARSALADGGVVAVVLDVGLGVLS